MKVIYDIGKFNQKIVRPILAIGVFDGLHVGHQKILRQIIQRAKAIHGQSVVVTFFPHPSHVLNLKSHLLFLSTLEQRLDLIESMGIDICFVVRFTSDFASLSPREFIEDYLIKRIHPREVYVGYNFHFGHNRIGNPALLKELGNKYGFVVHVVSRIRLNRSLVSSSSIRRLLTRGQLTIANKLLGREFSLRGKIEKGDGRGHSLGFPTANLSPRGIVLPPPGVYVVHILWKKRIFEGVANLGTRPSFKKPGSSLCLEVYLLNFSMNLYGQKVEVRFIKKLRNEKKFISSEFLLRQIKKDINQSCKLFSRLKK